MFYGYRLFDLVHNLKKYFHLLWEVLSSKTDSLSTCRVKFHPDVDNCRQNNGQEINAVMFRPKSILRVTRWIIRAGRVNSGGLRVKHAAALTWQHAFLKKSHRFEGLFLSIFCFLNVSFLFQISTLLCRQNRIFVDMSYFLKIAVLSPILLTKRLSTTALHVLVSYPRVAT